MRVRWIVARTPAKTGSWPEVAARQIDLMYEALSAEAHSHKDAPRFTPEVALGLLETTAGLLRVLLAHDRQHQQHTLD